MTLPDQIRIKHTIGTEGQIKKGDTFTRKGEFYVSDRLPGQNFTAQYIDMHLNRIPFDLVSHRGGIIDRLPFLCGKMFEAI